VRFVHHEQADMRRDREQAALDEVVVGETFGRDEEQVELAGRQALLDRRPILLVRGIDGFGTQARDCGRRGSGCASRRAAEI
jgi:hypothetical protein